jgi:SAM-dependent methyltransferase
MAHGPVYLNQPLRFRIDAVGAAFAGCNERIVEIPFIHNKLPHPFRGRVLDVGCCESQICFEIGCLGFEAWGIDIRPQLLRFPGVFYVQGDICRNPFAPASFDVVIACSTVEHIGLITYGNADYTPEGDRHAVEAIHRILRAGGKLILTVPFGEGGAVDWYRVYNYESLRRLVPAGLFKIQDEEFWVMRELRRIPAGRSEAEQVDSLSDGARAVACISASRVS